MDKTDQQKANMLAYMLTVGHMQYFINFINSLILKWVNNLLT